MQMRVPLCLSLFVMVSCTTMSPQTSHQTVPHVDLSRYMGNWYVIANIPYLLEKGKVASYDIYAPLPDGRMSNVFTFRNGSLEAPEQSWHGVAWVVNRQTNAEWKVRFLWPLSTTYLVLALDPDYRWSVVGTPNHKLMWVLARSRQMDRHTFKAITNQLSASGIDPDRLQRVPQPE